MGSEDFTIIVCPISSIRPQAVGAITDACPEQFMILFPVVFPSSCVGDSLPFRKGMKNAVRRPGKGEPLRDGLGIAGISGVLELRAENTRIRRGGDPAHSYGTMVQPNIMAWSSCARLWQCATYGPTKSRNPR
jgi:hypothetical protein